MHFFYISTQIQPKHHLKQHLEDHYLRYGGISASPLARNDICLIFFTFCIKFNEQRSYHIFGCTIISSQQIYEQKTKHKVDASSCVNQQKCGT